MPKSSTSVLVVGGGLAGLSAALFLAWRGVPTVLVERHASSSPHPRAMGFTPRTMELFRAMGLGPRVPQAPPEFRLRRARVESLAGEWFEESAWTPTAAPGPKIEYSPCTGAAIAQDELEPILRGRAIELGADIRFSTELLSLAQNADGVTAELRQHDGTEYTLHAEYAIAADGHRSPIREALGIGRSGRGHLRTLRSVLFRAPLAEYLEKGVTQFEIDQPNLKAFLTTYGGDRWVLMFMDDHERSDQGLREQVNTAIGRSDLLVDILTTGRWELSALIADRYASGKVFLAGDAAHTLPPARGGYGANTGIEDAHNLAWKLAAVVAGESTPKLLDTYDDERRPIGQLRHDQIFSRPDYQRDAAPNFRVQPIDDDAMEFGQLYRSDAVMGADAGLPPALKPDQWAGQPGTRAPHSWFFRHGAKVSTLDLFQRGWVLLTEDDRWRRVAARVAEQLSINLACVTIGSAVRQVDIGAYRAAVGLSQQGALLVRPDGYVAWRSSDFWNDGGESFLHALTHLAHARGDARPRK
jgi:putative polyketide hydroxylase